MKAVLLAPTPPPAGGIAGWTERMLKERLKDDWSLVVVDEKAIGKRQVFGKDGGRNLFVETLRCGRIWRDLIIALKDHEVKVVHSCIPSVTTAMLREYVCALIAKRFGKKFIIHFRCTVPNTTKGKIGLFVLKRLCNKSDLIISLNQQSLDYLSRITKTPIQLIPNFITSEELATDSRVRDELKTILYVGGLIESKGVYDCLEIAKRLPNIRFRFVGKGNNEFEDRAKFFNLSNVFFTGQKDRDGVKEEYKNADVFLFLTYFRGEGFSNALCEAMAAGLPCVVTNWAANKDMIGESGGVVVNIHDIEGVVEAIKGLQVKSIREAMSRANIRKVKEKYLAQVVIDQYVDAYKRLVFE